MEEEDEEAARELMLLVASFSQEDGRELSELYGGATSPSHVPVSWPVGHFTHHRRLSEYSREMT